MAGNAKVGNRINMITRWQALEYVTSQNLERRALAALGCITVVPAPSGPGTGRRSSAWAAFPQNTLAEDQDLTLALLTAGYKVLYDSSAIGWTEAPDTVKGPCQAALPLGLRHAAVPVEAPAGDAQTALWCARAYRRAADLAVPVPAHRDRAARGLGADLADQHSEPATVAASGSVRPRHLAQDGGLLSRLPRHRPRQRHSRSPDGAARKMEAWRHCSCCSASATGSSCIGWC